MEIFFFFGLAINVVLMVVRNAWFRHIPAVNWAPSCILKFIYLVIKCTLRVVESQSAKIFIFNKKQKLLTFKVLVVVVYTKLRVNDSYGICICISLCLTFVVFIFTWIWVYFAKPMIHNGTWFIILQATTWFIMANWDLSKSITRHLRGGLLGCASHSCCTWGILLKPPTASPLEK